MLYKERNFRKIVRDLFDDKRVNLMRLRPRNLLDLQAGLTIVDWNYDNNAVMSQSLTAFQHIDEIQYLSFFGKTFSYSTALHWYFEEKTCIMLHGANLILNRLSCCAFWGSLPKLLYMPKCNCVMWYCILTGVVR